MDFSSFHSSASSLSPELPKFPSRPYGCGTNKNGIPFWGIGEFTTHFRTYFSGSIESDVHRGYN